MELCLLNGFPKGIDCPLRKGMQKEMEGAASTGKWANLGAQETEWHGDREGAAPLFLRRM